MAVEFLDVLGDVRHGDDSRELVGEGERFLAFFNEAEDVTAALLVVELLLVVVALVEVNQGSVRTMLRLRASSA